MTPKALRDEIFKLLADIWDSLAATPEDVPVPDWHKEELDRRVDNPAPGPGLSWEEARMRLAELFLLVSVAFTAACGDDYANHGSACRPTPTQVCMLRTAFSPSLRTVTAGTTVEWIDFSGIWHTVTSTPASSEMFDQAIGPGLGVFSRQFNTPGTYAYYCRNHGTPTMGMRGTIQVN